MTTRARKTGVKRLLNQRVSPAQVADMLASAKPALIQRLIQIALYGRDADSLAAIRLALEYMIGKPVQQSTNVSVTLNHTSAHLETLRNLSELVPTIDAKPLKTLDNSVSAVKADIKEASLDELASLASGEDEPGDHAVKHPPGPPTPRG